MIDLSAYRLAPLRKDGELNPYKGVHDTPPDGVLDGAKQVALVGEDQR